MDSGTIYNALWSVAIFLILLVILGRFAWRPVLRAVQQREKHIADTLADAANRQARTEKLLAEVEEKVKDADRQTVERLRAAKEDAENARRLILAAAREEAGQVARQAADEISEAKREALDELYARAGEAAAEVAESILNRRLDRDDQQRLIEESLRQIRQLARQESS